MLLQDSCCCQNITCKSCTDIGRDGRGEVSGRGEGGGNHNLNYTCREESAITFS